MLRFSVALLIIVYGHSANASSLGGVISKIENELAVKIILNEKIKDSWSSVTYEFCHDSLELTNYLTQLYKEYSKYPTGFFQRIGIDKILICKDLSFDTQYRAAVPDPYNNLLFLSINGQKGVFTNDYLIYVMHHELHHCTEYAIWKNMYYQWSKWDKLNTKNFKYMKGGVIAYKMENSHMNWTGSIHPQEGFINLYSTTGQEEDRSELMALLMTDKGCTDILKYYPDDKIIQKKLDLLVSVLNKLYKSDENYWTLRFTEIKTIKK